MKDCGNPVVGGEYNVCVGHMFAGVNCRLGILEGNLARLEMDILKENLARLKTKPKPRRHNIGWETLCEIARELQQAERERDELRDKLAAIQATPAAPAEDAVEWLLDFTAYHSWNECKTRDDARSFVRQFLLSQPPHPDTLALEELKKERKENP
jgi:hypothetical protein